MQVENYNLVLITAVEGKYIFSGEIEGENPDLNLVRGETYVFEVKAAGHPLWIKTVSSQGVENAYTTGVTNNGVQDGTLTFKVADDAPAKLFYNCQFHDTMKGDVNISDPDIEDLILRYTEQFKK